MLYPEKIQKKLNKEEFCIINNFFSKKKCDLYIEILKKILNSRIRKKNFVGQRNSIVLYNYFLDNYKLLDLIFNKEIDKVLKKLIEEDYVLTTATARNQYISNLDNINLKTPDTSGQRWHTDNRYIDGKALSPSLSTIVSVALEDFTKENGSTLYLKRSHTFKEKIKCKKNSNIGVLTAKKGSLIFIDTNLLHKAGEPSKISRWSIFNIYSPWFVKPYFQFHKIVKKNKLSKSIKKILHFNSVPPLNYTDGLRTVIK